MEFRKENIVTTEQSDLNAPLTNHIYESMNIQRDEWEDKRNNKRLNQGTFTNLWLFIIALYCAWEIAKDVIVLLAGYNVIDTILKLAS